MLMPAERSSPGNEHAVQMSRRSRSRSRSSADRRLTDNPPLRCTSRCKVAADKVQTCRRIRGRPAGLLALHRARTPGAITFLDSQPMSSFVAPVFAIHHDPVL
jgi:hypothetical protein